MEDEIIFEKYGDTPLYFSHYYNFLFIFKSLALENGEQIQWKKFLHWWSMSVPP